MSALAPAGCLDTIRENLPSYGNHKPLLSKIQASAISQLTAKWLDPSTKIFNLHFWSNDSSHETDN